MYVDCWVSYCAGTWTHEKAFSVFSHGSRGCRLWPRISQRFCKKQVQFVVTWPCVCVSRKWLGQHRDNLKFARVYHSTCDRGCCCPPVWQLQSSRPLTNSRIQVPSATWPVVVLQVSSANSLSTRSTLWRKDFRWGLRCRQSFHLLSTEVLIIFKFATQMLTSSWFLPTVYLASFAFALNLYPSVVWHLLCFEKLSFWCITLLKS